MPPTTLATLSRFHHMMPQKTAPKSDSEESTIVRALPLWGRTKANCQKAARFTFMKAKKAPKFSNSPACSKALPTC